MSLRAKSVAARRDSIIPRIAASSLSTPEFQWRYTDAWNDDDMSAFMALAQPPTSGFFRPLPFETGRRREPGQLAGRWLLGIGREGERSAATMSVEAQAYFRQFRVLHLIIGSGGGAFREHSAEALSLMISALIIFTRCDVVKLIPDTLATADNLAALGWGDMRRAWSPRDPFLSLIDAAGPVSELRGLVSIDPHEWWMTEGGARDKQILSYLEKRMDMADRLKPGRKPKRDVFARLSRLLRWS